jgi:hypothetical protein
MCYRGHMKRRIASILISLTLVFSAFAKPAKPAPKPVSGYMRSVGLLYLETVEELDCGRSVDDKCQSRWESTLNGLEDRIDITLSQSKRPSGDKPFLDLLKEARYARMFYERAYVQSDLNLKAWAHAWVVCSSHAHTVAVEGEYFDGDGGCSDAISQASK